MITSLESKIIEINDENNDLKKRNIDLNQQLQSKEYIYDKLNVNQENVLSDAHIKPPPPPPPKISKNNSICSSNGGSSSSSSSSYMIMAKKNIDIDNDTIINPELIKSKIDKIARNKDSHEYCNTYILTNKCLYMNTTCQRNHKSREWIDEHQPACMYNSSCKHGNVCRFSHKKA